MSLISENMQDAIEFELHKQISRLDAPRTKNYHEMLTYHMGWTDKGAGIESTGKRIRPLLVLLVTAASGGNWSSALPAAAAVELVHNFSLVHDDIQDNSEKRRGRDALWKKWGLPQGINAGDGLFAISNLAITDLADFYSADIVLKAGKILLETSLELTRGQFLDISYETRTNLDVEDYWPMISGKTAALLSACCSLGALLGDADESTSEAYRSFGHYLGLAYQIQDDILGIWGNEALTGKSASSDLITGKKSLPVLAGLRNKGEFASRWLKGSIQADEVEDLAKILAKEGGYDYAHKAGVQMTNLANNSLREANIHDEAGDELNKLVDKLLKRDS